MAGDPLRPVRPGEHSPLVRDTRAVNAVLAAARDFQQRRRGAGGAEPLEAPLNATLVADMKYDGSSIATLAAHSVLAYGTPLIDPAVAAERYTAQQSPAFVGATPTDADKPFAITLDPIKGQQLGRAAIAGLAVVQVDVVSTSHWRAKPIVGSSTKLRSCSSGGVPILWKESGTGDKWAMVLLDFADPAGASADCSTLSGLIRSGFCGTLSQVSALGSCSCVPSNTISLTWDTDADAAVGAADDPILGCPPGVTTTLCPDGAPNKFKIVASGFTAPNTNFNQTYTVTHSTGEVWTQTKNGVTATLTQIAAGNWQLVLDDGTYTANWTVEGASCCANLTLSLGDDGGTAGAPATLTALVATACGTGTEYTPYLDLCTTTCEGPKPRLRLVPTSGGTGSATIVCTPVGCGTDGNGSPYMDFATSDPAICTNDVDECGENAVVFRVTCASCYVTTTCSDDEVTIPKTICMTYSGNYTGNVEVYTTLIWQSGLTWQGSFFGPGFDPVEVTVTATWVAGIDCHWVFDISGTGFTGCSNPQTDTFIANPNSPPDPLPVSGAVNFAPIPCDPSMGPANEYVFTLTDGTTGCPAATSTESYNCLGTGSCIDPGDGSGEYATLAECAAACGSGGTPPVPGGAGCLGCGILGETPTLVVPDGTYAGTYVADSPWAASAYPAQTTFTVGGETISAYCDLGGTAYLGIHSAYGGGAASGSSACGPPVVMTFSGSGLGATGNATVTT